MKTQKKKNKVVTIWADKAIVEGQTALYKFKNNIYYQSDKTGIPLKSQFITLTKKGMLSSMGFKTDTGATWATYDVTLSDLEKLLKDAKTMSKYWKTVNKQRRKKKYPKILASFIHLSPDLSFWVKYE